MGGTAWSEKKKKVCSDWGGHEGGVKCFSFGLSYSNARSSCYMQLFFFLHNMDG
jgi:hypothetical protein